jgi:hypothetical protein
MAAFSAADGIVPPGDPDRIFGTWIRTNHRVAIAWQRVSGSAITDPGADMAINCAAEP